MPTASSAPFLVGIDVGGTNIRFALAAADQPTTLLTHHACPTPPTDGRAAFMDFVEAQIKTCFAEIGRPGARPAAIGLSSPGIIDAAAGIIVKTNNLGWSNLPLAALLQERFGTPAAIENDVRAAALAEFHGGVGAEARSLVYLTVSTGVACGIIVDGRLLRGSHNAAGEIAFFVPTPEMLDQDWSANGALESHASGVGIARQWRETHPEAAPDVSAADVFERAHHGDLLAARFVREAADAVAQAAIAIGALIDPELLVLGGSIALHEPRLAERIRTTARAHLPKPFEVVLSTFANDAPLIGALSLAASLQPARAAAPTT